MLKIQVLGRGMIPRGYGLAPRKEFFNADLNLIGTILMTPGLKVNMLNPEDGKIIQVTNSNLKTLWNRYRSDINRPSKVVEVKKEDVVESKFDAMNPPVEKEVAKPSPVVDKKEEVKEEVKETVEENKNAVIKPILETEEKVEEEEPFVPQVKVKRDDIDIVQDKAKGRLICKFSGISQIDYTVDNYSLVLFEESDEE